MASDNERKLSIILTGDRLTQLEMSQIELQLPKKATLQRKDQAVFELMQDALELVMEQTRRKTGRKLVSLLDVRDFLHESSTTPNSHVQSEILSDQ